MVKQFNMVQTLNADQQKRSNIVVAASGLVMANGQAQDPMLAQVRLRNGEMVYIKDLPEIKENNRQPNGDYMVSLVADHEGKVGAQVGAAWLFIKNEMLHALVVWTTNKIANDLKPLADDGFLQFSTEGYVYEIDDDGKYGDFWIDTLSPVTSGNDPATQVLNQPDGRILIKNGIRFTNRGEEVAVKTETKTKKTTEKKLNELTPEERDSIVAEVKAEVLAEIDTEVEVVENEVEEEVEPESTEEEVEEEIEIEKEEEVTKNKISTTPKAPVANQAPKQTIVKVTNGMSSDGAFDAYIKAVRNSAMERSGQTGVRQAMNAWKAKNAITGDEILPTKIAETFFKAWLDNDALAAFRFMNSRAGAVYAATTTDTALGHVKGADKTEQTVDMIRRDLKALALYKKLTIDRQDIFDDESGNLIRFRSEELASRITNQILVAALLGGEEEGSVESTAGNDVRGLYGILTDANAAPGTFGSYVATEVEGTEDESAYDAAVRTVGAVARTVNGNITSSGRSSNGITLFVPYSSTGDGWITRFLLSKNETGGALYPSGTNLEEVLRVKSIIEVPELEESGALIAVADGAYQLYGENSPEMYPFFDTTDNTDKLLAEQFIAGSLAGYKQAAVYTPSDASE